MQNLDWIDIWDDTKNCVDWNQRWVALKMSAKARRANSHQLQAGISPKAVGWGGVWGWLEHVEDAKVVAKVVDSLEAGKALATLTFIPDHSPCPATTPASVAILAAAVQAVDSSPFLSSSSSSFSFFCLQHRQEGASPGITACLQNVHCNAKLLVQTF